jgi:Zinc-binding dehydrogenase
MPYARVIPHSDGAGYVDRVGDGVSADWVERRVWCYGAQSYRAFGTAAEYAVVPAAQVVPLPEGVPMEQGACPGIPGITAHRAVHGAGSVERTVLVQGGAGAVGACTVQLAHRAGAFVIGVVRSASDESTAKNAGAHHVLRAGEDLIDRVRALAPAGVHHAWKWPSARTSPPTSGCWDSAGRSPRMRRTRPLRTSRSGPGQDRQPPSAVADPDLRTSEREMRGTWFGKRRGQFRVQRRNQPNRVRRGSPLPIATTGCGSRFQSAQAVGGCRANRCRRRSGLFRVLSG